MGRRRGRRTRSDSGGRRRNVEAGFPTFRHNQWTFEGQIERLGHLSRSMSRLRRSGSRRQPLAGVTHAIVTFLVLVVTATLVVSVVRTVRAWGWG
jgi:hypothetical protein